MKSLSSPDSEFPALPDRTNPVEQRAPEDDPNLYKHPFREAYHQKRGFELRWMGFLDSPNIRVN